MLHKRNISPLSFHPRTTQLNGQCMKPETRTLQVIAAVLMALFILLVEHLRGGSQDRPSEEELSGPTMDTAVEERPETGEIKF
jgi:hypothetical protein